MPYFQIFDEWQWKSDVVEGNWYNCVETQLNIYYFYVRIPSGCVYEDLGTTYIFGNIRDALCCLSSHNNSRIDLQVPDFLNGGEPGLFRINKIFKSAKLEGTYIALTSNNKWFVLQQDIDSQNLDLVSADKIEVWSIPQKSNTYSLT